MKYSKTQFERDVGAGIVTIPDELMVEINKCIKAWDNRGYGNRGRKTTRPFIANLRLRNRSVFDRAYDQHIESNELQRSFAANHGV